jgi:hypothetical protein
VRTTRYKHACLRIQLILLRLKVRRSKGIERSMRGGRDAVVVARGKIVRTSIVASVKRLVARSDDWSGHAPIPPSLKQPSALRDMARDRNGGIRREPELPQHEEVVMSAPLAGNEFDTGPDDDDADAVRARALNRSMQGLARSVSLDPDDQMGL